MMSTSRQTAPTRRDTIKAIVAGVAGMAFGGIRSSTQAGLSSMMYQPQSSLCRRAFEVAERAHRAERSRPLPEFVPSQEIQEETGLLIAQGKTFHSQLQFGSAGQFCDRRIAILEEIPRYLSIQNRSDWKYQQPYLSSIFGQFFGDARVRRETPAMAWIVPVYVSTKYALRRQNINSKDILLDHAERRYSEASTFTLGFSPATNEPTITVPLKDVLLAYPTERGVQPFLKWMSRVRTGTRQDGSIVPRNTTFEQNLGLAGSGDEDVLNRGYYPAQERSIVSDERGRTNFIRMHVLFLARLRDRGDFHSACVHQLFISLDSESAWTLDINTANRDFDVFVRNYVGLDTLVTRALGGEDGA